MSVRNEAVSLNGTYEVIRVVDGDTIILNIDDENVRVRLIGVDTPESVHSDKSKNTEEGVIASNFVKDLLDNQSVYLEYDVSKHDRYNRLLAYVYLDDGETMLNRLLINNGYATIMTIQPNVKYADEFYSLQVQARTSKVGFWKDGFFE